MADDGHNINPAWSPDGSLIAYTAYGGLLTLMAASGSEKRVLAPSARSLGYPPVWSPDDSQIAFVGLEGDSKEGFSFPLYIVRPDGSELTRLWDVVSVPTWSPDGSRIAFFLAEEKSAVLNTWDLNGTDLRLLLSVEEVNFSRVMHNELLYDTLSWSPDAQRCSLPLSMWRDTSSVWMMGGFLSTWSKEELHGRRMVHALLL